MTTPTNSTNPFAPEVSTPLCSPARSPLTENPDLDEDVMREMTASYSEISQSACSSIEEDKTEKGCDSKYPDLQDYSHLKEDRRPPTEFFTNLEGTIEKEGDNLVFIAQDLENKLKLSSPTNEKSLLPDAGIVKSLIESNILNNIEVEACRIAHSVDMLTENLVGVLESVSALTLECLETYRDSVCKTCEIQDANIKAMYQLMAKCEQLSITVQPVQKLAQQVKEVRRLIDLFEDACNL